MAAILTSAVSDDLSSHFNHFFSESSDSTSNLSSTFISSPTYDDELLFMQNFFSNSGEMLSLPFVDDGATMRNQSMVEFASVDSEQKVERPTIKDDARNVATSTHLYSDMYLSYLLNGTMNNSYDGGDEIKNMTEMAELQAAAAGESQWENPQQGKREMDLMEMLSFHCYSWVEMLAFSLNFQWKILMKVWSLLVLQDLRLKSNHVDFYCFILFFENRPYVPVVNLLRKNIDNSLKQTRFEHIKSI